MTFGGSDIPPTRSSISLGPLFPSSAPTTSSPLAAPSPFIRPSLLRQFRSLTSLNSSGSTAEALTALERGCAKLVRAEGDFANCAKNRAKSFRENSSIREPLLLNRSLNTHQPVHWSTFNRTTLGPEPPPFAEPYGPIPSDDDEADTSEAYPSAGSSDSARTDLPSHRRSDWRSLYVASFLSFCTVVQFSLYFSSMWPYLEVLDKNATERFFGYIVASYSFGQILGSPIVGFLSNRMHKIRHLLYVGLLLMFCGNGLYLSVHLFRTEERKYLLCIARFITGIGSSNITLLKAYASTASIQKDRSRAIAFVTGGVALGSTMGPAFQLLFTPFGFPGIRLFGLDNLRFSMFTAPAFMACAMNIINALCIKTMFAENYVGVHSSEIQQSDELSADNKKRPKLPPFDKKAVLLCYCTRFTQMFVNTNLETLGAPLAMMMFAWTRAEAVKYISIAQVAMSLLAFGTYVVFILFRVDKVITDRANLVVSLTILIMFHLMTYSYPFLPGKVQTFHHRDIENKSIPEPVGCDVDKFTWCDSIRPIPPVYFYFCYVFSIGLAFPNINVSLNTLFSKIIGPRRQGTEQGILQMSGAFARMVGPIVISSLYMAHGPQSAWLVELTVVFATLALWLVFFRRMVPLSLRVEGVDIEQHHQPAKTSDQQPVASLIDGQSMPISAAQTEASRRRTRSSARGHEERTPLVEPIDEGDEDGATAMNQNDATVSTVASLR